MAELRLIPLATLAWLALTTVAGSQDFSSWMEGKWGGKIASYGGLEPGRVMVVIRTGDQFHCLWYIAGTPSGAAKSCGIASDSFRLITSADSVVSLTRSNDQLVGTFTLKNGKKYAVSLVRNIEPTPLAGKRSASDLRQALVGRAVHLPNFNTREIYYPDGTYMHQGSGISRGKYRISEGTVCYDMDYGTSSCRTVVIEGDKVTFTREGRTFPGVIEPEGRR